MAVLTIIGSTRTLYLQRRSPTSNFLGEKVFLCSLLWQAIWKNPLKGRRLWAHYFRGYHLPWSGSHGHRNTRSPGTSMKQSIASKWGLANKLPHPPSMTLSLQWDCTPESFYKLPTQLSTWSYRRQFTFNPPHSAKWNLGLKEKSSRHVLKARNARHCYWHVSFERSVYICVNEEQIFKLCVMFINLSIWSNPCPSDDFWEMQALASWWEK